MKIKLCHSFEKLVSVENLLKAWQEFLSGKEKKKDVQEFRRYLMHHILSLRGDLINGTYRHDGYQKFEINDPKPRTIHKATVRDRVLHRAVYRILYPFFDRTFIADSFSCRNDKGTHRALNRFRAFAHRASKNNTVTCWVLKCDVKKFFANISHNILIDILEEYIPDSRIMGLLCEIIGSFNSGLVGVGLPLGNLTSQLFSNVYLNPLDQFIKHRLKAKYYIRYADDFVLLSEHRPHLEYILVQIKTFTRHGLHVSLHPDKIFIKTLVSGMDFLGWVHFFDHRVLRTTTKKRAIKRLAQTKKEAVWRSYLGLMGHGNTKKLKKSLIYNGNKLE